MSSRIIYAGMILALWLIFAAYWVIAAIGVKRDTRRYSWLSAIVFRIFAALFVLLLARSPARGYLSRYRRGLWVVAVNPIIALSGVVLCALGIALAIWARRHLGRNWSAVPTLKEGHELVTTGPYARVRHPIYTGILTALLGSALTLGAGAGIAFVGCCVAFLWRVRVEERLMQQQFPYAYPAYRARTKALIPFVF